MAIVSFDKVMQLNFFNEGRIKKEMRNIHVSSLDKKLCPFLCKSCQVDLRTDGKCSKYGELNETLFKEIKQNFPPFQLVRIFREQCNGNHRIIMLIADLMTDAWLMFSLILIIFFLANFLILVSGGI